MIISFLFFFLDSQRESQKGGDEGKIKRRWWFNRSPYKFFFSLVIFYIFFFWALFSAFLRLLWLVRVEKGNDMDIKRRGVGPRERKRDLIELLHATSLYTLVSYMYIYIYMDLERLEGIPRARWILSLQLALTLCFSFKYFGDGWDTATRLLNATGKLDKPRAQQRFTSTQTTTKHRNTSAA